MVKYDQNPEVVYKGIQQAQTELNSSYMWATCCLKVGAALKAAVGKKEKQCVKSGNRNKHADNRH